MIPIKVSQPSYSRPIVTVLLIVVNMMVFFYQSWLDPYELNHFMALYSLRPAHFHAVNLITHMFLHGGWIHVLGNMLFLWVFGESVEDILGHWKFLLFYLLCGVTAALCQVAIDPYSRIPMVGASGAIAGIMGAYLVKFPRSEVKMITWFIFIFTFELPAWLMLVYWFALQLFGGFGSTADTSQGGTAFFAHIGGFVAGIVLVFMMGTRQRYWNRKDLAW